MTGKKLLLVSSALMLLASCGGNPESSTSSVAPASTDSSNPGTSASSDSSKVTDSSSSTIVENKTYTYNTYTTVSPSNWNELTYQDNNDTQIMRYLAGGFFSYNYKFDEKGNIIPGQYDVQYDAIAKAEDVTLTYAGEDGWAVPLDAESGYAYEFTLRDDIKWDDGTAVKAEDFVYTMKQQLDPLFKNYRADSFYNNSLVIHNAYDYVMQGTAGFFGSRTLYGKYSADLDDKLVFHVGAPLEENDPYDGGTSYIYDWLAGQGASYPGYIASMGFAATVNAAFGGDYLTTEAEQALEGKTYAEIKADPALSAYFQEFVGFWVEDPETEILDFFVTDYTFPEIDFSKVGLFADTVNPLKFTLVLDSSIQLFKEDGKTLSYHAAYDFGSLPLVKKDVYEANKHEPAIEGGLWTSTYNSSVASSASWGPYKLASFQAGKEYVLERNENWYGYNMPEYREQYMTDRIVCQTIPEYETAFLAFRSGDIDGIGLDVSVAADYKNSQRAVFTADDFVQSMQLQSDAEALKARETDGIDKEILTYIDFRQAISVGFNRAEYTNKCTTSSLPGYGLFNSMHYYDVENGGVYRNEDVAKKTLCDVYGVDVDAFDSLDEAYASLDGGNNLTLARSLVTSAYNQALADEKISATDKVELVLGTAVDNVSTRRTYDYINGAIKEICVGTPLEGRIEVVFDTSFGTKWATDFRAGAYDICTGGWSGAAWNPGYFLMAYLDKQYVYAQGWDTEKAMLTFNPYDDGNADHEYTMSLMAWWRCLNSKAKASDPYQFNWGDGFVDNEIRLNIIAALEGEILKHYYSVPIANSFTAELISYKIEYASRDYNTFMAYGGIRYMTYNYDDAAWAAVKGTFDYKL